MQSSLNALKSLRSRLNFLIDMVKNSEEVRKNHEFMRRLNNICSQLPITSQQDFDKQALGEYADLSAVNMLASVTKGFEMINELIDDFKTAVPKKAGFGDYEMEDLMGQHMAFGGPMEGGASRRQFGH